MASASKTVQSYMWLAFWAK